MNEYEISDEAINCLYDYKLKAERQEKKRK